MCEDYYSGSEVLVPASKAPSTSTLQYLPHRYLQKSLLSFKICIDTHVSKQLLGFSAPGRSSEGRKRRSHHTLKGLQASHLQISFPHLLPIGSSLSPWHYPSVTLVELKSTSHYLISLFFLFVLKQSCEVSRKGVGKAKFCLPGLPRDPTCFGSGSILHRWAAVFYNCNNNYKSNNDK